MDAKLSRAGISPPVAPKKPSRSTYYAMWQEDDYAWLRASNWQAVMRDPDALAPDIRAHLDAENAYTKAGMAETEALQERLFAEMKGRIKQDDATVPAPDGAYLYYTRFVTGGEHPLFCRHKRGGGEEELLLDGNALSMGHAYFRIAGAAHSKDHRFIAYAVDTN